MRRLAFLLCISLTATASAQRKTVMSPAALIYRYLGDTIWMERDTTVNRTIYRGDTVIRATFVNDSLRSEMTYVSDGSMARVVALLGKDGKPAPLPNWSPVSLEMLMGERRMLEMQLRMEHSRAQIPDAYRPYPEPTPFSDGLRSYDSAPDLRLVQFKDSVRYIRGCPKAAAADTTTYVLFGMDSVKRVKPARMFGQTMAVTIVGTMRLAAGQEWMKSRSTAMPTDLPRGPECR